MPSPRGFGPDAFAETALENASPAPSPEQLALTQTALGDTHAAPSIEEPGDIGSTSRTSIQSGALIKHYELIRKLGEGGMGVVFLARDTRLGRRVAIKFLHEQSGPALERFLVEARATALCQHENIVVIHDVDEFDGYPYMVLEYIEGRTLFQAMQERRRADNPASKSAAHWAIEIMIPVVRALSAAHAMNIVHRDLKPENILLPNNGLVKVVDFGIAKQVSGALTLTATGGRREGLGGFNLTHDGATPGTLMYMSPEQWLNEGIDARTDIWAVGLILFELLVGEHPLAPVTLASLAQVVDFSTPMPSARERRPDAAALGEVIDRCLKKRKNDRYASAEELRMALEALSADKRIPVLSEQECPFAGLSAFQEADAARYFGREQDIAAVIGKLRNHELLAIAGPSGAGKSSFVCAGVIPALKGAGRRLETCVIRPGRKPLAALVDALSVFADATVDEGRIDSVVIEQRLLAQPGFLGARLRARCRRKGEDHRILLFVDQFEELYTLGIDPKVREAFCASLLGVADDPSSPLRVILSMRADFLDRLAEDRTFLSEVTRGLYFLPPMAADGLRDVLKKPLERAQYQFENERLVEEILSELVGMKSPLPILQFLATKLWETRDKERRLLTTDAYRALGGVAGALSTHADAVLSGMSPVEQRITRAIFLRLVTPERTRAIVLFEDLCVLSEDRAAVEQVVQRLAEARLLSIEAGDEHEGKTVELVHESLIERWPRLGMWLDQADDYVQFRGRLRTAAKEWETSGRSEGLVWRGDAAEETRRFWTAHGERSTAELNARETAYVMAVLGVQDRERRLRRRMVAGGFVSLVVIMLVVSSLAVQSSREAKRAQAGEIEAQTQRNEARAQKAEAERSAARARNVTRMAAAGQLRKDPLKMLALLREMEPGTTPSGWRELATQALAASNLAVMVFAHDDVRTVAWSPDGKRIASGSGDKSVRVWNVDGSGEPIVYRGHSNGIYAVAWSPDGKRIASASMDHTLHVWNSDGSGEPIVYRGHGAPVRVVAWHPDGKRLFTGAMNKTMGILNIDGTGTVVPIEARYGSIHTAAWSPDRERVVTGGRDGKVRLWSMDLKAEPTMLDEHESPVNAIAWSQDGRHVVTGADDGAVKIWNADGSGGPVVLTGYRAMKIALAISPDSRWVAFGGGDTKAFKIANMDGSGHPIEFLPGSEIVELTYSPDGRHIASVDRNGTIHVWNVERSMKTSVFRGHTEGVYGALWSPDGERIASVAHDNTLRIWNAGDGTALAIVFKYAAPLYGLAWSPDGKRVATSARDRTICIWNADGSGEPLILRGHDDLVHAVTWSPDGSMLASCGSDSTVRIWKGDGSGTPLVLRHAGIVFTVAFSPDGKRILSSSKDSTARVWNVDGSGEPIVLPHETGLYGAAFSPDGKYVVTGSQDRIVRLWNADGSGKPIEFKGHTSVVSIRGDRVFTPDGKRIVTASDDGTAGIWNTDGSGEPLFLRSSDAALNMAAFSPDGKRVVTASDDMNVTIWDDLTPLSGPEDARLWTPSRYCMPLDLRRKLLDFSDEQSRADLARCQERVGEASQ